MRQSDGGQSQTPIYRAFRMKCITPIVALLMAFPLEELDAHHSVLCSNRCRKGEERVGIEPRIRASDQHERQSLLRPERDVAQVIVAMVPRTTVTWLIRRRARPDCSSSCAVGHIWVSMSLI
jgi:hypothetical protein